MRWVSSGDDDWVGTPSYFEIRYSANAIANETDWPNAASMGTVTATGPSGTQYDQFFPVPAGTWYFSVKAVDEANNKSPFSNSPTATIKSKAEFYVDYYLPTSGFYLDYDEVQSMMQGVPASGIPSRALDIGTVMARAPPGTQTPEFFRDYLLEQTNGRYNTNPSDPPIESEFCGKYIEGMVQSALDWDNINIPKRLNLHNRGPPTDCNPGYLGPYEFTDTDMQELRNIIRDHLIKWVDANRAQYCDLAIPCAEGQEWGINH